MRKRLITGLLLATMSGLAGLAGGCNQGLVTGYEPRRLGAGPAERRAYYAPRFTREAAAAEQERQAELGRRRPDTYQNY